MPTTKPDRIPEPQPENARQAVMLVRDDHRWKEATLDLNSTDGIKRNIQALWAAVDRLAGYVDGTDTSQRTDGVQAEPYQTPQTKAERQANQQATDAPKSVV